MWFELSFTLLSIYVPSTEMVEIRNYQQFVSVCASLQLPEQRIDFQALSQNCKTRLLASYACMSVCLSVYPSVRPLAWKKSAPNDVIFKKLDIWRFFETLSGKFKFHKNMTRKTDTLHEEQNTFMFIPRSVLLRIRNVSDKCCTENQNTHFMFNTFFLIVSFMRQCEKECRAGQATDDNTEHSICMVDT